MPHDYTTSDIARFQSKVKVMPSGCHEWQGSLTTKGYGQFRDKRTRFAHRVAWEMSNGPIPKGLECCHSCDNPRCVNPEHLWLGTHRMNMNDCASKGRKIDPPHKQGRSHGASKITEEDVVEIRRMGFRGESWASIARSFGIHISTAFKIGTGKTWKHVDYPVLTTKVYRK